jgi:hypothetical protein
MFCTCYGKWQPPRALVFFLLDTSVVTRHCLLLFLSRAYSVCEQTLFMKQVRIVCVNTVALLALHTRNSSTLTVCFAGANACVRCKHDGNVFIIMYICRART